MEKVSISAVANSCSHTAFTHETGKEIQIFTSPQFGDIRVQAQNEKAWFCLADVCKALDLDQVSRVKSRLKKEGVIICKTLTNGGIQDLNFIDEPNLYRCIFQSRKPEATAFQDLVTDEILPTIRRTGGYMVSKPEETPEQIMARALLVANDTIERNKKKLELAEKKNERLESRVQAQDGMLEARSKHIQFLLPRVAFARAIETSDKSILVGELSTILKQNGVEIGQNRLFEWLRKKGYLCTTGERHNLPTQRSLDMGLFEIKKQTIQKPNGTTLVTTTPKVTGKGQIYFVNKFLYEIINSEELEQLRQDKEQHEAMKGGAL